MRWSRADWYVVVLLVFATLLLYGRTATFDFVHYDDPEYVFRNPHTLGGVGAANTRWAFRTFELANWHPLTWLSYMTDVTVFGGGRPGPMHLVNALLHAGNAVLLFVLLREMTGSRWRSALVAALFALHPLHVESVAWVSERKDVLSTLFGLLAMLAYVRYARAGSLFSYGLTVVAFALSLLAKPMLVTLPFLLLLLDFWPLQRVMDRRSLSRAVVEKLPLLALAGASSWVTILAQSSGGAMAAMRHVTLPARLANALVSYLHYLVDTFRPVRLTMLYPMPRVQSAWIAAAAGAVLLLITTYVILTARRRPQLATGWFWFIGTLVPVIGFIAVGEQARADRYTYFPLIGLFIMIAWSLPAPRTFGGAAVSGALAGAILIVLSVQTWRQISLWRNSQSLFAHALSVVGPHPSLYINYAIALSDAGQHEQAIDMYGKALQLRPGWAKVYNNLGNSLMRLDRFGEAIESYQRSIEADPRYAMAYYNLGTVLARQGHLAEGERLLREALRLQPDYEPARQNLNNALILQGKPRENAAP